MATSAPPSILMPALPSDCPSLQGDSRHFISRREFEVWSRTHPSVRPQTVPTASTSTSSSAPATMASTASATTNTSSSARPNGIGTDTPGYRAPQHPVSHLLQSIPPRAPSRSSRSNILSYTVHLATSSRLEAYTLPNGARALLHRAEDVSDEDHIDLDDSWLDAEQKSQGLWKLGVSLLRANRREGDLPASVARRVELAGLTEELLSNPTPEGSVCKITSHDVVASEAVPGIKALQVLTSPDTTTLYHSTSAHAVDLSRPKNTSIAQSLINMKFAKEEEGCTVSTSATSLSAAAEAEDKPTYLDKDSPARSVFSTQGAGSTSRGSDLTAAPHMDYRIVRGQAMRSRAKDIFGSSILPSTSTTWCRRHRVGSCSVCLMVASTRLNKHRNVPGQGLDVGANGEGAPGKRPLVDVIPRFLSLSAHLLKDARDRVLRQESDRSEEFDSYLAKNDATQVAEVEIAVTAAWFSLLHSFVIQACLEGYLVDGWTGTSAIETLFGCGCGVWEGRGWSARVTTQSATTIVPRPPRSTTAMDVDQGDDADDDSDDDDDDDEEAHLEVEREKEKGKLVEAAQLLFGSRDVAQADFERSMRDRIHEFLNVPEGRTLKSHLTSLSSKYRLSEFENDMYEFLNATIRFLGKPSLAKQYEQSLSSKPINVADMAPDPWALTPFFARVDSVAPSPAVEDLEASKGKKRRTT
ncbi:BZ3500_MvSof-1268-A1-R1_Chr4-2g07150 [Microbotryum saponariae]|uniref:BZ3500_MvSof-1268-A1-R1_Chr4-2g07150 protein n=1 Tax=Microbotryum saponariae TaxID=289078 RepID=A0A2X0MC61_9BASI|nr:BZ3500_MvSof-1268-A1-R1_Chr4-2g07150 [Microbotryum saponariae]SDA06815.1 BZ3501_MvSof-1269-A2-R1_Chr4-2g06861 [Microbotryum saponariae]